MKIFKNILIAIAIIISASHVSAQDWHQVNSGKGNFTILFPAVPTMKIEQPTPKNNNAEVLLYKYEDKKEKISYIATASFKNNKVENIRKYIETVADNYPNRLRGKISDKIELQINDVSGLEIDLSFKNEISMRVRIFYNKGILYEIIAEMPSNKLNSTEVNRFMNSFEVNEFHK